MGDASPAKTLVSLRKGKHEFALGGRATRSLQNGTRPPFAGPLRTMAAGQKELAKNKWAAPAGVEPVAAQVIPTHRAYAWVIAEARQVWLYQGQPYSVEYVPFRNL